MTVVDRIKKLEKIGNELKEAMRTSLEREPPTIIFHPSRKPDSDEFKALFLISTGNSLEYDIRAAKEGYPVKHETATSKMNIWDVLLGNGIESVESILGRKRTDTLMRIAGKRDKSGRPFSINTFKDNIYVKDLTLEELQRLGKAGGEEILGLGQFLDLYGNALDRGVRPGRLSVDVKDGDENTHGNSKMAKKVTQSIIDEMNKRGLEDNLFMFMQYSIPAFKASRRIVGNLAHSVCIFPSSIISSYGEDIFKAYAGKAIAETGAEWIGCKTGELKVLDSVISGSEERSIMVYAPPKESADIPVLMKMLRRYPGIKALQLDV